MSFIQFFGSVLQVTPHFHSLVPDGVLEAVELPKGLLGQHRYQA
ncbi:MAG TPA: transposase [Archangium sp.]